MDLLRARQIFVSAFWLLLVLNVSACATRLAPAYDQAVVDGLTAVNTEVMTLLATVSAGTKPDTFAQRGSVYNDLIGKLDALSLLAGARPMPKNKTTDAINQALDARGGQMLDADDHTPPSALAIRKVAETLTKMRDTDNKQGVTAFEAQAFKGQITIYLDQAITYENFLQR